MNKMKKQRVLQEIAEMNKHLKVIMNIQDDEAYSIDNIPENLLNSYRMSEKVDFYEEMSDLVDALETAIDDLETHMES